MQNSKRSLILVVFALFAILLVACGTEPQIIEKEVVVTQIVEKEVIVEGETITVTEIVEKEIVIEVTREPEMVEMDHPVTLNLNLGSEPPTIDPSLATDTSSVNMAGNLFIGLTRFDPVSGAVGTALATEWESGEDADGNQTWTFHLRSDVAWINYNPRTGETTQVTDADGNPDFVDANDVVYGVKRTIDPLTASDYAYVTYIIKNAASVNGGEEGFTTDDIGVVALDDNTVQFTLESPAGFFPAIAGMWILNPLNQAAIEEWGNKWTEAGLIVTSGAYALEEWIHGGSLNLVKNPLWVDADSVQIERVEFLMIGEASTAFALYENNELDSTGVPGTEIDRVLADGKLSAEYHSAPVPCTYYYGFTNNKAPFDDARVRAAFVQSINRQSLIDNVTKGGQTPATSFAPPGIFGAPEPGTIGLSYDPEAAKASLQAYLDENGLTVDEFSEKFNVTLMHNTSEGHASIAAAIQQMWQDALGVNINVENQEWKVYLQTIKNTTPIEDMPHVYRLGWCADYPDQNNWVHEVFNSEAGSNRLRRGCDDANCSSATPSEFDEITAQAQGEQDPAVREELYAEAERILAEEEVAYAPIYHYTSMNVSQTWLTRNFPPLGADDYDHWTIDMDAKVEAQGN